MRFSERMRQLREERGWGVNEASRRLGHGETYVRDLERGKFLPTEEVLPDLAKLYGVSRRKLNDWLVADRLIAQTGEQAPGVRWFMRSLDELDEGAKRQAQRLLLAKLHDHQAEGDAWPDEFEVRERT
jgi:transcriptional regulator with XRE-family HTH domain